MRTIINKIKMQTKVKMVHPSGHCCSVCPSPRKYFCHSHSMIFCSKCFIRVHSGWIWEELRDSKETKDALREVKTVIERVKHRAKEMDIQKYVKDFWDEIKMIQNDYGDLEKRVRLKMMTIDCDRWRERQCLRIWKNHQRYYWVI